MALKRRIVVVGVGSIGRRHARLLGERHDLEVEICEPDDASLEIARRELGDLHNHASYETVLSDPPEIVLIATPQPLHRSQTIAALEAGCHVLCEKPMSNDLEDARAMQEAASSASTVLDIGFPFHFHPAFIRIKTLIEEGALGTVLHAHFRVGSYVTLVNSLSRHQRDLEGALFLDYAHQPDIFYLLFGRRPKGIYVTGIQGGNMELTSNPNVMDILCDYEDAFSTSIHLNFLQHPARSECEIVGDEGWLNLDVATGLLRLGNRGDGSETAETHFVDIDELLRLEHQAFFDAVDGKREPESPASQAIVSMEIIDAGLRSWREQQRIELPD